MLLLLLQFCVHLQVRTRLSFLRTILRGGFLDLFQVHCAILIPLARCHQLKLE